MAKNPNWTRQRVCSECGRVQLVRKDNKSTRCHYCSASSAGKKAWDKDGKLSHLMAKDNCRCSNCGNSFHRVPASIQATANFCSVNCKNEYHRVERDCKNCGGKFVVPRSRVNGKSNSSGNFCSRPCYEKWLCQTDRVNGRGSQWRKIRNSVISKYPFCAICGTLNKKLLQVHHIIPFRLCYSNDPRNLITLCIKCHKKTETVLHNIEKVDGEMRRMFLFFSSNLRERQQLTYLVLKGLQNENRI